MTVTASHMPSGSHLPLPRTPLVGRRRQVADVARMVLTFDCPVLTLTGPAGVGKTRLALQVAGEVSDRFADGVVFVPLAHLRHPALVARAIASGLRLSDGDDEDLTVRLHTFLRQRHLLLVLDNVEHLLEAAPLVAELVTACPKLQVLATSRIPFRLSVERDFPVPPLQLADPAALPPLGELEHIESVALFADRANAVDPAFALTEDNAAAVAEICVRLDGLPLAIELAATRTRLLPPQALLARLTNRLLLLTEGSRDQPIRLRTMRDAIAWSYDLLTQTEQAFFRRLAVFVGSFSLDAAVAINEGEDGLDLLAALVEKNLVQPVAESENEARFRLLETVREFAADQLEQAGEEAAAATAHAGIYRLLGQEAASHLRSVEQATWFDKLEREHPNLLATLTWFRVHREFESALRLAGHLGRFWEMRGHLAEGRRWIVALLSLADQMPDVVVPPAVRATAEVWAGTLAYWQSDYTVSESLYVSALHGFEQAGDEWGVAFTLLNLGQAATYGGDLEHGIQLISESQRRFERIGDAWGVVAAQTGLVNPLLESGDTSAAERLLDEALPVVRRIGDPDLLAMTLINYGWLTSQLNQIDRAEQALRESLELFRQIGERRTIPYTLNLLALLAWRRGDPERASSLLVEGLVFSRDLGAQLAVVNSLTTLGTIAVEAAQHNIAARLLGAAENIRQTIGSPVMPVERPILMQTISTARVRLGDSAFDSTWAMGRELSFDDAVTDGLEFARNVAQLKQEGLPLPIPVQVQLSRRELEVLRLLVEGHSNAEIAARLFISSKTVRNHVTKILMKLDVPSRTAAATFALRHGLI
jgi:non-specific serine/threonine protein kinase